MSRFHQIHLLIFFGVCLRLTTAYILLTDVNENDKITPIYNKCEDDLISNIERRLEKQNLLNDILNSKFSLLQLESQQQLTELENIKKLLSNPNNTAAHSEAVTKNQLPGDCAEAVRTTGRSGIHQIQLKTSYKSEIQRPFFVYCEKEANADGDAWTIIQRRQSDAIDFFRNWADYKLGFGNLDDNFFIGLEQLYALTQSSLHELWIQLEDFNNEKRFAKYETFAIGSEAQAYALNILGNYIGDAGDAMRPHQGQKFSTKDVDNDIDDGNCAKKYFGGWWYNRCHSSNLNGLYLKGDYPKEKYGQGIDWNPWHGHTYSLKYVHMAIRAVKKV